MMADDGYVPFDHTRLVGFPHETAKRQIDAAQPLWSGGGPKAVGERIFQEENALMAAFEAIFFSVNCSQAGHVMSLPG